jgi:hypothetical protein
VDDAVAWLDAPGSWRETLRMTELIARQCNAAGRSMSHGDPRAMVAPYPKDGI